MEQRREPRQPFFAAIDLLETESSVKIEARTGDLSLHGCYVDTMNPFPVGSKVRVRITHDEVTFEAVGRVAHAQSNVGMGVFFTEIQPEQGKLIAKWLASENA
jgi:D-serine deaminase-like pyridoxal phosphate-dependent protein